MREELERREGERDLYLARIERYGTKRGVYGSVETILLRDVTDASGEIVADHLWLTVGAGLRQLAARAGEFIEFRATASAYRKGYRGNRDIDAPAPSIDYKLANARKLRRLDADLVEINPDGPPRVLRTAAGWFASGNGLLYPCTNKEEAEKRVSAILAWQMRPSASV